MRFPYEEQLAAKAARVTRAFSRYPALSSIPVPRVAPADPPLGYRTRAKWMVGPGGELGLYARSTDHEVVDIPGCLVVEPVIAAAGRALRVLLADAATGPIARRLRAVDLRAVHDREGAHRVLATFVATRGGLEPIEVEALAAAFRRECPAVAGVTHSETAARAVQVLGPRLEPVWGETAVPDQIGSVTVTAVPGAFVQAHRGQAAAVEQAIVAAVSALGPEPRVLELFAGSGAFALALAGAGAHVHAVEAHAPAVELLAARRAPRVTARASDAEAFAVEAMQQGLSWDAVVVDPPRRGLTPELRRAIAGLRPQLLVYVSCAPETLARDLDHFARLGLTVRSLRALDMIPQTDEVESIAVLEPAAAAAGRAFIVRSTGCAIVEVAAHEDGNGFALPPPRGGSGLALDLGGGGTRRGVAWSALALVKGVPRKRGTIRGRARYVRTSAASGHALVRVEGDSPAQAASDLASIGHPVLGDPARCDEPTRRHFFEKHGLDRAAWHTDRITIPGSEPVQIALPGDLAAVFASLGLET